MKKIKKIFYRTLSILLGVSILFIPLTTFAVSTSETSLRIKGNGVTEITPANFLKHVTLIGDAQYDQSTGIVTLTEDKHNQTGSFSLNKLMDMNEDFTLEGEINLGSKSKSQGGADGIGLSFADAPIGTIGGTGNNMGIGGLSNAMGFKLDSFPNGGSSLTSGADPERFVLSKQSFGAFVDTNENKEAITYDGPDAPAQEISNPKENIFRPITMNYNGVTHTMTVIYDGKTWTRQYTNLEDNAYRTFSVSGSTGSFSNLQQFKISSIKFYTAGQVNIKYVDEDTGMSIYVDSDTGNDYAYISGRVGDAYSTEAKTFDHYALDTEKIPQNAVGTFTEDTQTVTYYYKKVTEPIIENGTIVTKFVDEETNESIAPDVNQTGRVNDPYTTSPVSIENYALDTEKIPKNRSGVYTKEKQTVTYYYKKVTNPVVENGTVITKFVDEETNESIAPDVNQTGRVNDPYATSGIDIANYALDTERLPKNSTGKYTREEQTVTYYYKKVTNPVVENGTVVTKFIDEETNESIASDLTQTGRVNDPYSTNPIDVKNYALDETKMPENSKGTYKKEEQIVTYYYKKVTDPVIENGTVVTKFVDEKTKESIASDLTQTGRMNDPYSTNPIDVKDYALDTEKMPENATGTYSNEKQIVTYYYKKVEAPVVNNGTVTTKFIDEETNKEIAESVVQTGRVADPYATSGIAIADYALDTEKLPANATGTFTVENQVVTYYYKKATPPVIDNGIVTTKFIDEETNKEIADPVVQTGRVTDSYVTSAIGIKGYKLDIDKKPVNASGVFKVEEQTVNYYYKKVESPEMVTGIVTVKFVDEATNKEIAATVKQSGRVDDPYKAVAKKIAGYTLDTKKLPKNREGIYTKDDQEVIFYYTSQQSSIAPSNEDVTETNPSLPNQPYIHSFSESKDSEPQLTDTPSKKGTLPDTGEKTSSTHIGLIGFTVVSILSAIQFIRMKNK
ncbi:TPA: MucBP domain-containing protein [Enterococcus faecalis]|nr:MucBP domain-containing protein [Enterococcus faecalis]EKQ3613724.1 MucBP domain-containing protein [Enterococcus faecalis]